MAKFDGYLFCSDLDDTLLTSDKKISEQNIQAIKYFMENGGRFTFATGRVPHGAGLFLDYIMPNAPMVCFNGGAVYDFSAKEFIWQAKLPERAKAAVEFVDKSFSMAGIEVYTTDKIYFCKTNRVIEDHKILEQLEDNYLTYDQITEPWNKVVFMMEAEEVDALRKLIAESEFADDFTFVQSSPWYYEILPKGATKGAGLLRLADYLGIDHDKTIGMGENENDLSLVTDAGIGVAVNNALECVLKAADIITVDNNSHAAKAVIDYLDKKL